MKMKVAKAQTNFNPDAGNLNLDFLCAVNNFFQGALTPLLVLLNFALAFFSIAPLEGPGCPDDNQVF